MIKEIKHKGTGMIIKVFKTEEINENGISLYRIDGYIYSTDVLPIEMSLLIPETSMIDFEITYKDFNNCK
jgi:RNA:NAD 2'-phosphotransferase (TPT1/KptA family)